MVSLTIESLSITLGEFFLRDVNLHVEAGAYSVLLGPTGAGKTVLLECLAGLHPEAGGWVFREWAPHATAATLVGDFSGWRELPEYALARLDADGLWELRLPSSLTQAAAKSYTGYFGSLFMGLTLGVVAAPCIGPFVLGLLTWVASMGSPWLGFVIFFTLSLGLGLPLFLLAMFSGQIEKLPRSGGWMVWIALRWYG